MRIFQEEIFGPVLALTSFDGYDEAISIANDTLYGLGAGVWSRSGDTALPRRPGHRGRPRLVEHLPPVPGARGVRRLQAVGHRPREPQDDARPLPADEEPPRLATRTARWASSELDPGRALRPQLPGPEPSALGPRRTGHGSMVTHRHLPAGRRDGCRGSPRPRPHRAARAADVPSVGRLLRRVVAHVLPRRHVPHRARSTCCSARSTSTASTRSRSTCRESQFEYWKYTHLTIDVVPGGAAGFSVEAPKGKRFLIRSRMLNDAELAYFGLAPSAG